MRQKTEQFIEIIKTEVLEEESKQIHVDILKKSWVVQTNSDINKILMKSDELLRSKEVLGYFGIYI